MVVEESRKTFGISLFFSKKLNNIFGRIFLKICLQKREESILGGDHTTDMWILK
jgi:hypothetical protein